MMGINGDSMCKSHSGVRQKRRGILVYLLLLDLLLSCTLFIWNLKMEIKLPGNVLKLVDLSSSWKTE